MERKDFIKKFAAGGSILLVVPAFLESCSKANDGTNAGTSETVIDLTSSSFSALGTVGGFVYKSNMIIIRTGESQYTALSSICTHQGCTVSYSASANLLPCPCHGSVYDISGNVINGPATKNLKKYNVQIDGNTLIIT